MRSSGQRTIDVKPAKVLQRTLVCQWGAEPCNGTGIEWTAERTERALAVHFSQVLHDLAGSEIVRDVLRSLGQTAFELDSSDSVEPGVPGPAWRVGEATGEAYLTDWRNCTVPWTISRDAGSRTASLLDPDLVGLIIEDEVDYLIFGETRTSPEASYAQAVMRGISGLRQQLKDLRDDEALCPGLIRYLLFRCAEVPERMAAALRRYLASPSDFRLNGVLVRAVSPDDRELRDAVSWLGCMCPEVGRISVLGLHLPTGRIASFAADTAVPAGGAS